jgi:hypothetical protein
MKLGFVPKAFAAGFAQYLLPGMKQKSGPERLAEIGSYAAPFTVRSGTSAPEGQGLKRAALGAIGLPVYGKTAEQKMNAKIESRINNSEENFRKKLKKMEE